MALRINTNIAAMNSYRNLSITDDQMSKSLEKLSSGFRINRAADDAAGLAISEGLRSQVSGLKVATRNAQDGISVVQTAEGALNESHSILQRMRDLSVQASNSGSLNADAKTAIQSEVTQLKAELTRIADTTKFNGKSLLDGQYNGKFQIGANVGETISVGVAQNMSAAGLKVGTADVSAAIATDASTFAVTTEGVATSAKEKVTVSGVGGGVPNGTLTWGGKSVDLAKFDFSKADDVTAFKAAIGDTGAAVTYTAPVEGGAQGSLVVEAAANGVVATSFTQVSGSDSAINAIDKAIKAVSSSRADLGALQNRFDHTINNLNVTVENLSASESRIRDADMAQEMVKFTRNQILSQAGTAMLAQANQSSQGVLSLLR